MNSDKLVKLIEQMEERVAQMKGIKDSDIDYMAYGYQEALDLVKQTFHNDLPVHHRLHEHRRPWRNRYNGRDN